jgi:hypothetical protein
MHHKPCITLEQIKLIDEGDSLMEVLLVVVKATLTKFTFLHENLCIPKAS